MFGACIFMTENDVDGLTHTKQLLNLFCIVYLVKYFLDVFTSWPNNINKIMGETFSSHMYVKTTITNICLEEKTLSWNIEPKNNDALFRRKTV